MVTQWAHLALDLLPLELVHGQAVEETAFLQQLLMSSLLHDLPLIDDHDISIADGAEAVMFLRKICLD